MSAHVSCSTSEARSAVAEWRAAGWLAALCAVLVFAPAAAAEIIDIPASARVDLTGNGEPELPPFGAGEGACGLFVKALPQVLMDIDDATETLDDEDSDRRWDPDLAFRAIVPVLSLWDGAVSPGHRMAGRQLMPWSVVDEAQHGGGQCIDGPEEATTGDFFAIRLKGLLMIEEAGVHTFGVQGDDGFRMWIGDEMIVERPGRGVSLMFTRRVSFSEPGLYPMRVDYFEAMGDAYLAVHHATDERLFVEEHDTAGFYSMARDDSDGEDASGWALNASSEGVLPLLTSDRLMLPYWLDDDVASCVDQIDDPTPICTPDEDVSPELRCGNGNPADVDPDIEAPCDDGNNLDDDGCSASCEVEPGWVCRGIPSTCLEDRDGDVIPDIEDNCPDLPNPDQADARDNNIGDACDLYILSPIDGAHLDSAALTITGTVQPSTPVTLTLGDRDPATITASADGDFTWTPDDLTHGPWTLTANATVNGIDTTDTVSFNVWLDAPTVAITVPEDNATLPNDQPLTVSGTASANLTINVGLGDDTLATTDASPDGTWSTTLPLTGDRDGTLTLFATTTDPVGNTARDERSITLLTPAGDSGDSDTDAQDSSDDGDSTNIGDDGDTGDSGDDGDGTADADADGAPTGDDAGDDAGDADSDGGTPTDADDADEASAPGGDSGCGCAASSGSSPPGTLLLLLALLGFRRRAGRRA